MNKTKTNSRISIWPKQIFKLPSNLSCCLLEGSGTVLVVAYTFTMLFCAHFIVLM